SVVVGGEAGESIALERAAGGFGRSRIEDREPRAIERGVALAHLFGDRLRRGQDRAVAFEGADQEGVGLGETVWGADLNHPAALRGDLLVLSRGPRRIAVAAGALGSSGRRERRARHEPRLDL